MSWHTFHRAVRGTRVHEASSRFVLAAALIGMLLRLAVLDSTMPELTRGASFAIEGVGEGFTASQILDVRDDGFEEIRLDGQVTGVGRDGVLEARLMEIAETGEQEVRQALYAVSRAAGSCCRLPFHELAESAGKRYRVDLHARGFDGTLRLSLRAMAARAPGGLVINGHRQPANLIVEPGGAALYPLPNAPRVRLWWLLLGFAVIDGSVAFVLFCLMTSGSRFATAGVHPAIPSA
jgi:hypothetical protein